MSRKLSVAIISLVIGFGVFTGCSKKIVKSDTGEGILEKKQNSDKNSNTQISDNSGKLDNPGVRTGELGHNSQAGLFTAGKDETIKDVFFDFDRYTVRSDSENALQQDAEILKRRPVNVVIEGHCDERGSDEYNIALGEKRAASVMKYLVDMGVDPAKLAMVSFGSEKPFCAGHNEECWQKNRTAHFLVTD